MGSFESKAPEVKNEPKPGDLIQIFRGTYQHWAIFVGSGYVIHLVVPAEYLQACSQTSAQASAQASNLISKGIKGIVKKERLLDVVGQDSYCINNILDDKYEPRPVEEILQDAKEQLGKEPSYSLLNWNCEHFATKLRYGIGVSSQVQKGAEGLGAGLAVGGIFASAASVSQVMKNTY